MPLDRVDVDALARRTAGFSGADLKALSQQAAVEALTRASAVVTTEDMDAALTKHGGEKLNQPEPGRAAGPYI